MEFNKINGLNYEEYKKEVKRRQSMAGKEIGIQNLKNASKQKANKAKEKVYTAIRALKNLKQKITIMKIVEVAEVSKTTASKYINQAKEEGIL
jgi:Fic family protein